MTLKNIGGNPVKIVNGKYKLSDIPKPHSSFESYVIEVAPKAGLCWIKAIGKNIFTSVYGIELKSAFNVMREKLEITYGKNKILDFLMPDSIWKEPKYFMMAMTKKEQNLITFWDSESGSTLPNNIKQIALNASAVDQNTGYITLEYSFTNKTSCDYELTAQEDSAL